MNRSVKIAAAVAALAGLGVSAARAEDGAYAPYVGPYIGGAVLQSRFDSHHFSVNNVDNEDTSWKADAGLRFNPNFALEADYARFGKATAGSAAGAATYEAKANGYSAFAVGLLPLGRFDLFAKAGASRISSHGNLGSGYASSHDVKFAYGAGAQLGNGRTGLKAEYERFDTDTIGVLNVISLGLSFNFGMAP